MYKIKYSIYKTATQRTHSLIFKDDGNVSCGYFKIIFKINIENQFASLPIVAAKNFVIMTKTSTLLVLTPQKILIHIYDKLLIGNM